MHEFVLIVEPLDDILELKRDAESITYRLTSTMRIKEICPYGNEC